MRHVIILYLIWLGISTSIVAAPLQYLTRYTVAETSFENPTATNWNAGDDSSIQVNMGFNFPFNNTTYNQVWINSNGILSFSSSNNRYSNSALPYTDEPQSIYPYWDDLNRAQGGTIRYETYGSAPYRHFVIAWNSVPHYSNYGGYSLEVVLYENGDIRFRYDSSSNADGTNCSGQPGCSEVGGTNAGATIGVQEDTSHYDAYSYDAAINQSRDVLYRYIDNGYSDWHFDELSWNGTANEIMDSHATNHGTGHSVSPTVGKICNAIDFRADGTSDYATLGKDSLDRVGDFTVAVWHKGVSGTDSNSLLSGANVPQYNEFIFWFNSPTRFNGYLNNGSRGSVTHASINDSTWKHFVWRRAGENLCFFIDGALEGCQPTRDEVILEITSLIMGQEQDNLGGGFDPGQDWEGILDELLIFRRALSDSEISIGYNNQDSGNNWDGTARTCPSMPIMSIVKSSCVIDDPVNATTNPKRIPSATIRYAIEVRNTGSGTADNVIVDDNLSNDLEETTITNLSIDGNNACDCLVPVAAGANGANGGVSGNNVKLDFDTVVAGATECGYFEVEIK